MLLQNQQVQVINKTHYINTLQSKNDISVTQDLLFTMLKHGISIAEIAKEVAVAYTTVKRWADGTQPKFYHFQKLVRLYAVTVCKY